MKSDHSLNINFSTASGGSHDIYIYQSANNFCKWRPITRRRLGMRQLGVAARAPGSRFLWSRAYFDRKSFRCKSTLLLLLRKFLSIEVIVNSVLQNMAVDSYVYKFI